MFVTYVKTGLFRSISRKCELFASRKATCFIQFRTVWESSILHMSSLRQIFESKRLLVIFSEVSMFHHQVCRTDQMKTEQNSNALKTILGGHALRFSIGADDRQVIQPPASPTVPCTGLSVYNLFKELGTFRT